MNSEEYLQELARVVKSNFHPGDGSGGMTAARAGFVVRQVLGIDPASAGFFRFKDALLELERRGILRVGTNTRGALAVWLHDQRPTAGGDRGMTTTSTPATAHEGNSATFRPLRNAVWLAFVGQLPTGKRYMHRDTGDVRQGLEHAPEPSDEWALIEPIDEVLDKADAVAFLRAEGRDNSPELRSAIELPNWFREFSGALQSTDPFLAAKWKRRRSNRVIAHVEQWRRKNGISNEVIFERPRDSQARATAVPVGSPNTRLKDVLLSAIRHMEVDDLLELRLPARHLVAALRPELLSQ